MSIEKHRKELDRIANIEDYDDDDDAIEDGEILLGIALAFEDEIARLEAGIRKIQGQYWLRSELKKLTSQLLAPASEGHGHG